MLLPYLQLGAVLSLTVNKSFMESQIITPFKVALNWGDLFISSHSKRRRSGEKCKRTSSEPREMYKIMHIEARANPEKITATIEQTENEVRERTHFKLQPIRIPSTVAICDGKTESPAGQAPKRPPILV